MEFIFTDRNRVERGVLSNCSVDIEIGAYNKANNDFEISVDYQSWNQMLTIGSFFYCVGTEYGGIIEGMTSDTGNELLKFTGTCPRGILENELICPKTRTAEYYVFKGEANTVIRDFLLSDKSIFTFNGSGTKTLTFKTSLSENFVVDEIGESSIYVNYQARYLNAYYALEDMLSKQGAKLEMQWGVDGKIHIRAVPIVDYSNTLELDNDYNLSMLATKNVHNYNHCIGLGKGELQNRIVINIFKLETAMGVEYQELTDIKDESLIPRSLISLTYEYGSVESFDELKEKTIKKLSDMQKENTLQIDFEDLEVNIGDIVGGSENISGVSMKKPITKKIVKSTQYDNSSKDTIEYKVGD